MSAHRRAWRSLVAAYVFISASQRDLLGGVGLPGGPGVRPAQHHSPPGDAGWPASRRGATRAGWMRPRACRVLMAGWDRYPSTPVPAGLRLVIAGAGPLDGRGGRLGGDPLRPLTSSARSTPTDARS